MKKVVMAMSGGLDSSVAAALLKRAGFDVVGIFMKFWSPPLGKQGNRCCSPEAEIRARKVAKVLKIPFYVCDFEKEFKKRIVDYFLKEYRTGKTPNPCVVCNKEIKFGLLLEKALQFNADFVATGHYSRLKKDKNGIHLLRAEDKDKDQSYFLWQLHQKQLRRTLFPIGNYTRKEVESLAKKFKLPVLGIKKSVEICFIKTTINDFLSRYIKPKPGLILTPDGKKIGQHEGLPFYTIGQRKGIKLPGGPYYVLDKDLKKNFLIVTKNEKDLYKKELAAKNVNWIHPVKSPPRSRGGVAHGEFNRVKAKIRYRHQPASATITKNLNSKIYNLKFKKPQRAITPGQSVVFYQGQELLGGGIIC